MLEIDLAHVLGICYIFVVVLSKTSIFFSSSLCLSSFFVCIVSFCDKEILKCVNRVKYCSEGCQHES